jgi:hypothetical protein
MVEIETVSVNLGGNFAGEAAKQASAADALAKALVGVGAGAAKVKTNALGALGLDAGPVGRVLGQLRNTQGQFTSAGAFEKMLGGSNAFGKISGVVGKVFGAGASDFLNKGAAGLARAADSLGVKPEQLAKAGSLIVKGGAAVGAGAAVLAAAAAALVYGAARLVTGAVEFGIEQSSIKEKVTAAIGKEGYDVAIKVAGDFGIDQNKAFEQVKGLLAAKFSATEVPAIIRIAAGIGELKGEGKAAAFLEKMEAMANKGGKANEEAVKGFAEVGISSDKVYAALAKKLGVSIDQAKAKVKSGAVDMKVALQAVQEAAGEDFGPVADKLGKSVPGLLNKIKIQFAQLFANMDLGPLRGALEAVSKVLGGPAGEKLGASLSKLGNAVLKALFGPFEGAKGEERLTRFITALTGAIEITTSVIVALAPYIENAVEFLSRVFSDKGASTEKATGFAKALFGVLDALTAIVTLDMSGFLSAMGDIGTGIMQAFASWSFAAMEAGLNAALSFADGIGGGLGAAIAAAANLGHSAIQAAKQALGIASPSKAFAFIGNMSAEGYATGANDNDSPAAAGEAMAAKAAGGAAGAAGATAAAGAKGGGGLTLNLTVNAGAGADGQKLGEDILTVLRPALRQLQREAQERAA